MNTHKTPNGTVLPLLNLKGKFYLEVKFRVVWFREVHPDWSIETEFLRLEPTMAIAKATIKNVEGRVMSVGTKSETPNGFPDFIEKSESGAIGRALALIGFGTQFCGDELDEGDRIVDSPVQRVEKPSPQPAQPEATASKPNPLREHAEQKSSVDEDPGEYVFTFGKFKGQNLKAVDMFELSSYVSFLARPQADGKPRHPSVQNALDKAEAYLKSREVKKAAI